MLLHPAERILHQSDAEFLSDHGAQRGTLILTNQRVVFESHVRNGLLGSTDRVNTILNNPLWSVTDLHVLPRTFGPPNLQLNLGSLAMRFRVTGAQQWATAIANARTAAPPPAPPPPPPPPHPAYHGGPSSPMVPIVVNVNQATAPLPQLHCKYCGGLSPGGSRACAGCGATL